MTHTEHTPTDAEKTNFWWWGHYERLQTLNERLTQALSELVAEHDVSNEDIPMGYGPKPDTFGIELARAALAEGETT